MYVMKLLGVGRIVQEEATKLDERKLAKVTTNVLQAGVKAIQNLNLTREELKESHNRQKAFTVAWTAMYAEVCSLSKRPAWNKLPGPKDAYEVLMRQN